MVSPQPSAGTRRPTPRALAEAVVELSGTPDDASSVRAQLLRIARLAAETVAGVDYASVTALQGEEYTTVAASSAVARAVDEAQYADGAGPCVTSTDYGVAVAVPDIAATMSWPGFVEVALGMGLYASVSIPLYAGRGAPVATLNLYGRDAPAMAPLIAGVESLYDPGLLGPDSDEPKGLDAGGEELLEGLAEAMAARATIQVAIAAVMAGTDRTADEAYLSLRLRAAETGASLTATAAAVIAQNV